MASVHGSGGDSSSEAPSLRIRPRNHTIEGLTVDSHGQWRDSFWFIQAADTQLGMIDIWVNKSENPTWHAEIELCRKLVRIANNARPKPAFLVVCGDLVDARPWSLRDAQVADFKKVFSELDPEIHLICVCGNHDIGDEPTAASIETYRGDFGDDFYSFWFGGVKFLVLNSQYYLNGVRFVPSHRREQDNWLNAEFGLSSQTPAKHTVVFQHVPPFLESPDEDAVFVPNSTSMWFNFPDKQERRSFLDSLKRAKVSHVFCGHLHRNAGGMDTGGPQGTNLEVVVTSAVGCQLGEDDHGFRAVVVTPGKIRHKYFTLLSPPTKIDLSENGNL